MSNEFPAIHLGAELNIDFNIVDESGAVDKTASVSNVNLTVDPPEFATITSVDNDTDDVVISSDKSLIGTEGTFTGAATVTWTPDGGSEVTKQLQAIGKATISNDPSAGKTLVMKITLVSDPL